MAAFASDSPLPPRLSCLTADSAASEGLDVEWLRAQRIAPLRRGTEEIVLAMERPQDADATRVVQRTTRRRPVLIAATSEEIDDLLDRSFGRPPNVLRMVAQLEPLLELLGHPGLSSTLVQTDSFEEALRRTVAEGIATEEDLATAVTIACGLPSVRLESILDPAPGLDALLPPDLGPDLPLLPLAVVHGHLLLACPAPPAQAAIQHVEEFSGFVADPILVPLSQLRTLQARLAQRDAGADPQASPQPVAAEAALEHALQGGRAAQRTELEQARLLARERREPLEVVALRLGVIDSARLERLRWEAAGVETDDNPVTSDPALLGRVPAILARRLGVLPLESRGGVTRVALADPTDPSTSRLLSTLLGSPVKPIFVSETPLMAAIEAAYRDVLPRTGPLDAADVAATFDDNLSPLNSLAIALGVPTIDLAQVRLESAAPTECPEHMARELGLVPLWQSGRVLFAAVSSPRWSAAMTRLEREARLHLRPVLSDGSTVDDALDRLFAPRLYPLPERYAAFEQWLGREHDVPHRVLVGARRAVVTEGTSTDIALVRAGAMTPEALAGAYSRFLKLPRAAIAFQERVERALDPLGREMERFRVVDPVDGAAAGRVDLEVARRLCTLPYQQDRRGLHVAVADPLGTDLAEAEQAIGSPIVAEVASRPEIEDAIRRSLGSPSIGDGLLAAGLISHEQLARALALSRQTGVRLGTALTTLDVVAEDQLYSFLGDQFGLPFFDVEPELIDQEAMELLPEDLERERLIIPIAADPASVTIASVEPIEEDLLDDLQARLGRKIHPVLTTEKQLRQCLDAFYRDLYLERAANELLSRSPDDSASRVLTDRQKFFFVGLLFLFAGGLALNHIIFLQVLCTILTTFVLLLSFYKCYLIYRALSHVLEVPITPEQIAALAERDLPIYTLLIPMYREAEVLPGLTRGLSRLDYPKTKLDVKLLLEEDDLETQEAARALKLPAYFQVVVVPHGMPKGKPKACNYGLIHAKGEYVVIYDAEDVPDPDQLKKALLAFETDPALACVQSKLNYYNRNQNLLTRWFTAEYSVWFDLLLPGLDASNAPIPLGGTSNHFRTAQLREMGGWDPYNVTEDADLGLRLFVRGWRTAVIDSTTYEEANSALFNWIRQRSRWVKGYIQTWLVRMRHPITLFRMLGPYGFFSFQMVVLGTFGSFLVNPFFWMLTMVWFLTRWGLIEQLFPGVVFLIGAIGLYVGNFAFTYLNVAGCLRRQYYELVKYALLSPVYWALMSVAAWKGFLQLFYRPFYWEKTQHGLYAGPVETEPAG